ncbi:MAG: succinyl-CoA synthetase beta subunit [Clostridia bacterium]|nr:succinyl-CoA synthetase beta subunit [Clostridia bacterium]
MPRLYEYQGKKLFRAGGIPVPEGRVATTPQEAQEVAQSIGFPVAIKAQVLAGKRGKAGAIKFAEDADEVYHIASNLLGKSIRGMEITRLLVEKKLNIKKELYLAITADPSSRQPVAIFSAVGGMDIEEMAAQDPGAIIKKKIDILRGFRDYDGLNLVRKAGDLSGAEKLSLAALAAKLYRLYRQYDCKLAEINPLVLTDEGFVAADARVDIDDDAVSRQTGLELEAMEDAGERPPTPLEIAAGKIDAFDHRGSAHFVQLDPGAQYAREMGLVPIGFDCVGTGASLAVMDELVPLGYYPINFCDTSGNPTASKLYRVTKIIFSQPEIQGYVFVSCVSSQQLDNTARGIIKALKELYPATGGKPNIPVVLAFRGAWDDVAQRLFEDHGIAQSPLVKILGREATEKDAAEAFDRLYRAWQGGDKVEG